MKPRLFKDQGKLSFDYVPDKLVHRERQMETLEMLFRPVLEGSMAQTAMLIGNVGTGKTATAKRFGIDLMKAASAAGKNIEFLMINCRQRNTEGAVMQRLVAHFDERYPDRGFSNAEMLRAVRTHLDRKKMHLVVILDEADVILGKNGSDLIYQLSRFDEEKLGGKPSLSLILISQKYLLDMVDQAALSTFKRANVLRFDRYQASELRDIVAVRASLAFHEGKVMGESIDLIADIAAENGDARFAIELLDKSGMIAEEQEAPLVNAEHVRAAKAFTYSFVTEERIGALDRHRKVILLSIARAMKEDAYVTTGEVEKVYKVVAEEYGERARAHSQFWSYLQDLSNQGLILTKVGSDRSGGRTTLISIPDMPAKEMALQMEQILAR